MAERAMRHDAGKPQLHYLDTFPHALREVARVFEYGAKKYAPYNYLKGAPYSESYSAARRHMLASMSRVEYDSEAKKAGFEIDHLAFAAWNILRLLEEKIMPRPGTVDDRPPDQAPSPPEGKVAPLRRAK